MIITPALFDPAVDVLRSVGLRSSSLSPDDAEIVSGPTGEPDAFLLQRRLSALTSGIEWELIGAGLPSQFGLYTVFDTVQYSGSILSITSETNSRLLLDVMLLPSTTSQDRNTLTFIFPGLSPISIDIPAVAPGESPFQDIGVRLKDSLLVVTVNCSIVDFAPLPNAPDSLSLDDARVSIFGNQATVRTTITVVAAS